VLHCIESRSRISRCAFIRATNDEMNRTAFDVLIGLRLGIVRRAADMVVVHFGDIRPHPSGDGTIGDYALHVQCPWRFDGPLGTVTGRDADHLVFPAPAEDEVPR
jgi:hypothetical protein